ncbi:MAG: hypothetical protein M3Z66_22915 [Chloroflexota bacterium]|nr:hypothetical protein [Chloroflexota bacterium]
MRRLLVIALCSAALYIPATAGAASPHRQSRVRMDQVTVRITATSGTVWGKVSARFREAGKYHAVSCRKSSCKLKVPNKTRIQLTQSPANNATWPFKDWVIKSQGKTRTSTSSAPSIKVSGAVTVTAVYVLHQSSSGYP